MGTPDPLTAHRARQAADRRRAAMLLRLGCVEWDVWCRLGTAAARLAVG